MTLAELITSVYSITNRPDMVGQTLLAIQQATLKIHRRDFFVRDIYETGIQFPSAAYLQSLEPQTLTGTALTRYRALKYARKTDSSGLPGVLFDVIVPELIFDEFGYQRTNVVYGAGSGINFKSSTEFQYIILGCYLAPDIVEATYSSWVAADYPFAIVAEAAASIFKQVGNTDEFAAYTRMAAEEYFTVQTSNIIANGY